MNNVLELKGTFENASRKGGGGISFPPGKDINCSHFQNLKNDFENILDYWKNDTRIHGALVSVYYHRVIPKTCRIKSFLSLNSSAPEAYIRGAKFSNGERKKHIFTYFVSLDAIVETIRRLNVCIEIVNEFEGTINEEKFKLLDDSHFNGIYKKNKCSKSIIKNTIIDAFNVEHIGIERFDSNIEDDSIVSFYETGIDLETIFNSVGVDWNRITEIDKNTVILNSEQIEAIVRVYPYLISMACKDLSKMAPAAPDNVFKLNCTIPDPSNEPVVGVIDTLFETEKKVYFDKWVDVKNDSFDFVTITDKDRYHGTAVSSIIVDGPSLNPEFDDGCGRFKVRHFGVALERGVAASRLIRRIKTIVSENRDIKVWNLSLGSEFEISENFMSTEGAVLDQLQVDYDIVFVVAGTNDSTCSHIRIGAPADSINSLVVNSVTKKDTPASYYRTGPVLSFFNKPDVSYYGGDDGDFIKVFSPKGVSLDSGTSFAAPWVTRKVAFLIYNMGCTREIAKALIIDAAARWERKDDLNHNIGYGIVPIRIEDILQTSNDEIRFFITGRSEKYETYTYQLPIPMADGKHPFYARATLCYFTRGDRSHGVDYTDTELDFKFGRVFRDSKGELKIKSLNGNVQDYSGCKMQEDDVRRLYRKWDNVKHINDTIKNRRIPFKAYESGMWGISITIKDRTVKRGDKAMPFGIVVTLKEMYGKNRISEFSKLCSYYNWIVKPLDIEQHLQTYVKSEEEITWD